jgi:hypothetical protein
MQMSIVSGYSGADQTRGDGTVAVVQSQALDWLGCYQHNPF